MAEKKTTKQNTGKLVRASARDLRLAPRKMRLVTNAIKGLQVSEAFIQLRFMNKKGAPFVAKLLKSAVANAENNFSLNPDQLYIKTVTCDMGKELKRYFPRARGSAFVIRRKLSHVNLILEERKSTSKKKSRFSLITSRKSTQPKSDIVPKEDTAGHEAAEEQQPKRQLAPKASEQVKANKVTQKRRLFNRKSGE